MDASPLDSFARLAVFPRWGSGIGFHRMQWLLADVLDTSWFRAVQPVRVTGSNGKGSVSAMLASIFRALDLSTGLYTSPHLVDFNERFLLDGQPIEAHELAAETDWVLQRRDEYARLYPEDTINAFEAFTSMAMRWYARQRPQALVLEAGIGGRYDTTRVLRGDLVALTALDLEHTNLLGETLELIACDKADLCPDGGTLVVGEIDPDVLRRLRAYCAVRRVELVSVQETARYENITYSPTAMCLDLQVAGEEYPGLEITLQGRHQAVNAATAILLARRWVASNLPAIEEARLREGIYAGLRAVRWPGRFERVSSNPDVYIDVGHTPAAIESLLAVVRQALAGRKILLVTGVSYDKKMDEIVSRLVTVAERVICTRAYHRGGDAAQVAEVVRRERPDLPFEIAPTIDSAIALAQTRAREDGYTVLVAGGLFLSIEAMLTLRGQNPQSLRFL